VAAIGGPTTDAYALSGPGFVKRQAFEDRSVSRTKENRRPPEGRLGRTRNDSNCSRSVIASIFARFQVREAGRTREAQSQPFVVVDIEPSRVWPNMLNLIVENSGTTLARDVRISFNTPLRTSIADLELADSVLLREGIPSPPPRRRVATLFDLSHDRAKTDLPMRYDVTVSFTDAFGRHQEPLRTSSIYSTFTAWSLPVSVRSTMWPRLSMRSARR